MFTSHGRLLREIHPSYAPHYTHLLDSGLYQTLVERGLLVRHTAATSALAPSGGGYAVIEPERIPFISYPFEWAAAQLRAAALTTLEIQRAAIAHGMTLKDASAYNVQFRGSAPVFIDTLSFERWSEGTPWVGYRQFCQHFLGPLALMTRVDPRLGALARSHIDGLPLDLAARLLPWRAKLAPSLFLHVHLHARSQARASGAAVERGPRRTFGRVAMLGLIDHLQSAIERLSCRPGGPWIDYYDRTAYSAAAMADKRRIVAAAIVRERPRMVWDLGCNTGAMTTIAASSDAYVVAFDADDGCIARLYAEGCARSGTRVLPLVMNLTNPTARLGWNHDERMSLADRGPADVVLALGLIHHLYFANQVPFDGAAAFFARVARTLLIEFIPHTDPQVAAMTTRMPARLEGYTLGEFEHAFAGRFDIIESIPLQDSTRSIYVMRRRDR